MTIQEPASSASSTVSSSTVSSSRFANGGVTRIAICSDTHIWDIPAPVVNGEGSVQQLDASHLLAQTAVECMDDLRPAATLHLGDQTSGGDFFGMPHDEFTAEVHWLREMMHSMRAPVYVLPGNHDCPEHTADWGAIAQAWGLAPGIGHTVDVDSSRLVLVNTQGHTADVIAAFREAQVQNAQREGWYYDGMPAGDPVAGYVSDAELLRVEEALATAGKRRVLLFAHQLLAPWSEWSPTPWRSLYGVDNAAAVLGLARKFGNVAAVLQGHAHRYDVRWEKLGARDCAFVVLPAVIEWPLAWLSLELSAERVEIELHPLPRPELAARGNLYSDVRWRAGRPEWRRIQIA